MTITLRQKDLENDNKSLYLDIYENGKRKFEFLSLYLIPEINQETKERNEATLKRAQEIRAERILHPETIPEKGHLMVVPDIPDDDSPEVIDWIQTYMEWMDGNPEYSKRTVEQTQYLQERMKEFLKAKRRPHITLMKFDKTWFKAFFLWLKNDYVPQKYVRVKAKPLSNASLRNMQQRIVAVFNKAVKTGKLKANPFYQLEKEDTISKLEKPSVFDPRGQSDVDPRKLFYFDPSKVLTGGVIFILPCFTSWPSSYGYFRQRARCGVMSVQFGQAQHRRQPGHRWHHTSFPQGVERP